MAPGSKQLTIPQKILNASASLASRGAMKAPRDKVAKVCGYPKQPTTFMNALRSLQKKGDLTYDKEWITLFPQGFDKADPEKEAGSNADALQAAKDKLTSQKQKKILDIVSDGRTHTYAQIAAAIGSDHTNRSFCNLLSPLKTKDFIVYQKDDGEKAIRAHENLFPFGWPSND